MSVLVTLFTACRHTRLPHTVTGIISYSNCLLYLPQIVSQLCFTPAVIYIYLRCVSSKYHHHSHCFNTGKLLQMECYFWLVSFLAVSIFCCGGISEDVSNKILTRKRRYLAFPEGSTFVVSRTAIIRQVITRIYLLLD